jgi:multiple sugar transport system substrate-binding protein
MNRNEITTLLKFINKTRILFNKTVSDQTIDADWKIFSYIISNHLQNKLCTTSSIIQVSGLPFATGLRKVNKLIKEKKLVRRSKTKSGKSFSIHPSEQLIKEFTEYLLLIKNEFASQLGFSEIDNNFYFGTSLSAGNIIPAPAVITNQSKKFKRIRFLSNDNPTFKVINKNLDFFEYIFDCKIELTIESDLKKLLNKIITNSQSNSKSKFDIVAFNIPWIGQLVNFNCLTPLDKHVEKIGLNLNDFHYSGIRSSSFNKKLFGIPIEAIPDLLFYRKDLFQKYELKPPENYEELFTACKILKSASEIESPISWPARKGQPLATSFILAMANFGKPYINLRYIGDKFYDLDSENISLKANFLTDAGFSRRRNAQGVDFIFS